MMIYIPAIIAIMALVGKKMLLRVTKLVMGRKKSFTETMSLIEDSPAGKYKKKWKFQKKEKCD